MMAYWWIRDNEKGIWTWLHVLELINSSYICFMIQMHDLYENAMCMIFYVIWNEMRLCACKTLWIMVRSTERWEEPIREIILRHG